jgi:uncharacterized membrane protein
MIKKMKNYLVIVVGLLTLMAPVALPAVGYADCGSNGKVANQVAGGAADASGPGATVGCDPNGGLNGDSSTQVGKLAQTIVNIFSVIVGAASIIMIIYAGFRYITSGGSSERIGNAKTTLIYAIIGLIVVALAQLLVHFVLSASINAGNSLT